MCWSILAGWDSKGEKECKWGVFGLGNYIDTHGGLQPLARGMEGQHWVLLSGDSNKAQGNGIGMCQERAMVGIRERFCTWGQWAWNRLPGVAGIAPNYRNTRSAWTKLSDLWINSHFVWSQELVLMIVLDPFQMKVFCATVIHCWGRSLAEKSEIDVW